jgi:hypothetical protein
MLILRRLEIRAETFGREINLSQELPYPKGVNLTLPHPYSHPMTPPLFSMEGA